MGELVMARGSTLATFVEALRTEFSRAWPSLLTLSLLQVCLATIVLRSGFQGISDDDFARVVIAQRFAETPHLDPSGTSWLPFPFWLTGGAMRVFGPSLAVARGVAVLSAIAALWLSFFAARLLGASHRASLLGAAIAAVVPYHARLGVSTVPELLTGALVVCGLSTLALRGRFERLGRIAGAVLLTAASASRYEAWIPTMGFAVYCAFDARRDRALLLPATIALAFPLSWLAHGVAIHGDPLFFVKRVSEYRSALGVQTGLGEALGGYPVGLIRHEPELVVGFAALVVSTSIVGRRLQVTAPVWRLSALLGLQLLVLVAGEVRGGAPTHHPERALIALWLVMSLGAGVCLEHLASRGARNVRPLAAIAVISLVAHGLRPTAAERGHFAARQAELSLGASAAALMPPGERLLVATRDYGYFAVMVGFEAPDRVEVFETHDPRELPRAAALDAPETAPETSWIVADETLLRDWNLQARIIESLGSLSLVGPVARNSPIRAESK